MLRMADKSKPHNEPALEHAIRRSELLRTRVIIGLSSLLAVMIVLRFLLSGEWQGFLAPLSVAILIIVYESLVHRVTRRADRDNRSLPLWFWRLNAALECIVPSCGIFHFATSGEVAPAQALIGPPLLGYAFFFTLQILSLRPSIILIGTAVSVVGYGIVVMLVHWVYQIPAHQPMPMGIMSFYPLSLSLIGLGGAGVCARIRSHVIAEIEHARHRESAEAELGAASKIQRSLLPEDPPPLAGFDVAGWNRPAISTGGDYYDWQRLPDGRVGVMLADVSGHGLGPALVAAFCRAYSRASLSHHDSLVEAVARVNALVSNDLPASWFITFVAAVLRPNHDEVELVSAGHGPILHYVATTRQIVASRADGVPLGIDPTLNVSDARRIQLASGDLLILVTDGFHEWQAPQGDRFGVERLGESIKRNAHLHPAEAVDAILKDVEAFVGDTPQDDDLTIVIVKRR